MQLNERAKVLETASEPLQLLERMLNGVPVLFHGSRRHQGKLKCSLEDREGLCGLVQPE
jgi:hypothetical protein